MFASITIDRAPNQLYDYAIPPEMQLQPGLRVKVPFAGRSELGYVVEIKETPGYSPQKVKKQGELFEEKKCQGCKYIISVEDEIPFFNLNILKLLRWLGDYYCSNFTMALRCALPAPVRTGTAKALEKFVVSAIEPFPENVKLTSRQKLLYDELVRVDGGLLQNICKELKTTSATLQRLASLGCVEIEKKNIRRNPMSGRKILPTKPRVLTAEQTNALEIIRTAESPVLLFGVTGSGKTEIYLQAIADVLENGQSAIMLVPEIALTPQTVQRFVARFGENVAVLHSGLSDGERFDEWVRLRKGEARVVVGPRSAVFAPVSNLGLIVVDEEHEPSYKQDEAPHYNARDIAVMRAHIENSKCILGSATPSLESWYNVQQKKYVIATLKKRVEERPLPAVYLINQEEERKVDPKAVIFSHQLIEAMKIRLHKGEQTILFLNRRGYSPTVSCPECGHVIHCEHCSTTLTYHKKDDTLRCHLCGTWQRTPKHCPQCGSPDFNFAGFGTQRVELALQKILPQAKIIRMDADSTSRKFSHDELLGAFRAGEANILLGTQMIAKGLDFPNVTLVGILAADMSLNMPDFRASERTFQLLAQVSGRAGRGNLPGEVFIQTRNLLHPAIQAAKTADYAGFAKADLEERETAYFPPFCKLACLTFTHSNEALLRSKCEQFALDLHSISKELEISPAMPAPIEKIKDSFRYQLIIRAKNNVKIVKAVKHVMTHRPLTNKIHLGIDIDAISLA